MYPCVEIEHILFQTCSFIESGALEESITDFIYWKFKNLRDTGVYSLNIRKFTRQEERQTGADLEITLLYNRQVLRLTIQAKKVISEYGSYCSELERNRENNQTQLDTLIEYSRINHTLPFYLFYSNYDNRINISCEYLCNVFNFLFKCKCVILKSAFRVKRIYEDICNGGNRRLSKYELVNNGNPFLCLFCCPISQGYNPNPLEHLVEYLKTYYEDLSQEIPPEKWIVEEEPKYVKSIKSGELEKELEELYLKDEGNKEKQLEKILEKHGLLFKLKKEKKFLLKRVIIIDLSDKGKF